MKEEKQAYMELLRVIAIFFVVFNHTRNLGYTLYLEVSGGLAYWGSLTLSILCKIAVPIFFMISGGLLLGRQESLKELFRKRILRYLAVTILFTLLQYLRIVRIHPERGFHPGQWLRFCFTGDIIEPYWFLYAYLSFLLLLPFLRRLAAVMGKNGYLYLLGLKAFSTVLGLFSFYTGIASGLSFPFLSDLIFYPLIGYAFLGKPLPSASPRLRPAMLMTGLLACLFAAVMQAHFYLKTGGLGLEGFCSLYVWILASLTVLWARRIEIRNARVRQILCTMGSWVFGTYLIEDMARNPVERLLPVLTRFCGPFAAAILFTALSVLLSMAVIGIARKIPFVRKLIG